MAEVTHLLPMQAYGNTACCGEHVFDLPRTDRLTLNMADVTCLGPNTLPFNKERYHDDPMYHQRVRIEQSILSADIAQAFNEILDPDEHVRFSVRQDLAKWLYQQGYRPTEDRIDEHNNRLHESLTRMREYNERNQLTLPVTLLVDENEVRV